MADLAPRTLRFRDCLSRGEIAIILCLALATAVATALLILAVREILQILETAVVERSLSPLVAPLAILAASAALFSLLRGLEFSVSEAIGFRSTHRLRMLVYEHMSGMAPNQIQHRSRGSLILRLTGDLTMLRTWLSRGFARGLVALFSAIGCLASIGYYSWVLACVVFATFAFFVCVSLMLGNRLQDWTRAVRRRRSRLTSNVDEQVSALAVVQVFGRSDGEASRMRRQSKQLTDGLIVEARYRGVLRGLSDLAGWIAMVLVLVAGANMVLDGYFDLSSMFVTLLAIRLMQGYVRSLGNAHEYWRRAAISRKKLEDFLNSSSRPLADASAEPLRHRRAAIVFENVSAAGCLENFTARVNAGRHVAIVGPSGSGKSTLLGLVARLVEVDEGAIHIGSQSVAQCQLKTIYQQVSLVGPQLPLMRGTLRRNLTYRNPKSTDKQTQALVDACHLNDLVESLPGGLDFWLTEGGANLSAGAAQRIRLARALCGGPPILLLDRAMDNLDAANRTVFRSVLARYAGTILSVTDHPDDIAIADVVWQIEKGRLVSESTSSEYLHDLKPDLPAFLTLSSVA
ncbi:ABC transporter ATP-binding protein [Aurantiacibacter hainanensis]|uniref:ABC transporter ATP-binding protein n=1 Tax=Aurantiacibacter hainanensis TaxID=3076114 RepID=UPI0030C67903